VAPYNLNFSNFEFETTYITTAASNAVGDVILLDGGIGVSHGVSTAVGTALPIRIFGKIDGMPKLTGVAWSIGAQLFWDPINLGLTNEPTGYIAGFATSPQVSADVVCNVILSMRGRAPLISALQTPVTGITGGTEAVAATLTIPANLLIVGDNLVIKAGIRATAQNSTDTLRTRIRIGGLTGTVVADTGAVAMAAATGAVLESDLTVTAISATVGTLDGVGSATAVATSNVISAAVASLNNTAAINVVVTTVFSSGSAGDTADLAFFTLSRLGG
jgi:Uncharacterized conserved protein (DUF2190)